MADVPGKFYRATKVRTGVAPSSAGSIEGEVLPPVNPPGSSLNSVGLTMPSAFTVSNSPLTSNGTIGVAGAGTVGQYIRGDGSLADFPQSSGGGSSVSYYLNGSVDQGTIGGIAYKELSKVPILGAGTDFTINADGYIASFITDAADPSLLEIPGGNWNFETYFSASSGGGSPTFYVELYKVSSGGTATLIASSSSAPELIAFGTNLNPYFSTLAVPTTTLALTDRLAVRYYVTHSGRTITLHTENNHLCQIVTTFTTGITALNGLTAQVQNFAVGTTGTDFNIASATATHTFNLPTASATNRGALSSADWSLFTQAYNDKINSAAVTGTTTKTLTLTQQDGGTITASWSDLNTDAVLSVFGRTGAVVAANGDYTTAQVTESGNLYYTDARSRAALSFAAGSGAYNTSTGVITIPTNNNQITNGAGYITSAALSGYLPLSGGVMTGPITTPNGTFGIIIGDDSRLADRNIANTLFLEGVQNNDRGYINFSQTTGNALGAINGGDLTWRGNAVVTGSASAGQIAYWSSGSAITGESALFWDASNNQLGIGTAIPATRLEVTSGNSGSTEVQRWSYNDGNPAFSLRLRQDVTTGLVKHVFDVVNNGTTFSNNLVLDRGNVGIGTPSPNRKLEIVSSGGATLGVASTDNGASILYGRLAFYTTAASNEFINYGGEIRSYSGSGIDQSDLRFYTALAATSSERFRIFNDGNVLIQSGGTFSNNGARLQVTGTSTISGNLTVGNATASVNIAINRGAASDGNGLRFQTAGTNNWYLGSNTTAPSTDFEIYNHNTATTNFRLAYSNGAATFSSSVTAAQFLASSSSNAAIITSTGTTGYGLVAVGSAGGARDIFLAGQSGFSNGFTVQYTGTEMRYTFLNGNVGIGVTPSAWANGFTALQVRNASIWSTGNDASFTANAYYDGSNYRYIGSAAATRIYHNTDGSIGWSQSPSGTAGNAISFTQAMTLFSTGNLLVGSPSPISDNGARLQVSGDVTIINSDARLRGGDVTGRLVVGNSATSTYGIFYGSAHASVPNTIVFATNSAQALLIGSNQAATFSSSVTAGGNVLVPAGSGLAWSGGASRIMTPEDNVQGAKISTPGGFLAEASVFKFIGGNVGIGTPSPAAPLHVVNSSNGFIQRFAGGTSSAITGGIFAEIGRNFASIGTISNHGFNIFTNDNDRLAITSGGNVLIGTTVNDGSKLRVVGNSSFFGTSIINSSTRNVLYLFGTVADNNYSDALYLNEESGQATGRQAISWYNANQNYFKARIWTQVGAGYGATLFGIDVANDARSVDTRLAIRNGNVLVNTTTSTGATLEVNGTIRTGTLDTGYVSGFWKLGRAVIGTQPTNTHQIIVEINGQLYVIPAASL